MSNSILRKITPALVLFQVFVGFATFAAERPLKLIPETVSRFPGHIEIVYDADPFTAAKLDFLVVMDNSGSMEIHKYEVAKHTDGLVHGLSSFPYTDYHIGVVTADLEFGKGELQGSPAFVSAATPNLEKVLNEKLILQPNGSGDEKFLATSMAAFSEPNSSGPNAGFLRADADLALLVVTDADDQSAFEPTQAISFFRDLKSHSKMKVHGFLADPKNSQCLGENNESPKRLLEFITAFGGSAYDLCTGDMSAAMKAIGSDFSKISKEIQIPVPVEPIVDTLLVTYGTQVVPPGIVGAGWIYDPAKKLLTVGKDVVWAPQPAGTKLRVSFKPVE